MNLEGDDRQVQDDVLDRLRRATAVDASDIGVMAERGVVTLSGRVFNDAQRMAAEHVALSAPGVGAIIDELVVQPLGAGHDDDDRIARAARAALDWAAGVPDERIKVAVRGGRARLEGTVDSPQERDAAAAAVCEVLGKGAVDNQIAVRPTPDSVDAVDSSPRRGVTTPTPGK